jgi:hypothetical protein
MDLQPVTPKLERLFRAVVEIAEPISVGMTPLGERRIIPITGGHFEGERLAGAVLPGGADWLAQRSRGGLLGGESSARGHPRLLRSALRRQSWRTSSSLSEVCLPWQPRWASAASSTRRFCP